MKVPNSFLVKFQKKKLSNFLKIYKKSILKFYKWEGNENSNHWFENSKILLLQCMRL